MKVNLGWSSEVHNAWVKMGVDVDENDLFLHFLDSGAENPEELSLSPLEKFKLMYSIAETFVQLHKMSRFPDVYGTDENKRELQGLINSRDKLTKAILERNE